MEYKVGLRLISNVLKGVIIKIINIESGEKSYFINQLVIT